MLGTEYWDKQDWLRFFVLTCFAFLAFSVYRYTRDHFFIKNGYVTEAIICKERIGGKGRRWFDYCYQLNGERQKGSTIKKNNVSVGDTIMIVCNIKNDKRSKAIYLHKGKVTFSSEAKELVHVSKMTDVEKKELADRLTIELEKKYKVRTLNCCY